jgi:hypothetical protein
MTGKKKRTDSSRKGVREWDSKGREDAGSRRAAEWVGGAGRGLEVCAGGAQLGEGDEAVGGRNSVGLAEHGEDGADRVQGVPPVELAWRGCGNR